MHKLSLSSIGRTPVAMLLFAFLFAFVGTAHAQEDSFPLPGITPASPLYFLERIFEDVGTLFTVGDAAKAKRLLRLSEERLAEARELGDDARAEATVARYEEQYAEARARAQNTFDIDLEAQVTDAVTRHLSVLDEVAERVPEEARAQVRAAKERTVSGQIEALRGIAERDPEKAIDIFARAAEGRLLSAQARAERGGEDEAEDIDEALAEYGRYAEFGGEIAGLAGGLQSGETTVEELVERATSHHVDVLRDVQSKVPAEAQGSIQRAMQNAERVQNLRPVIPVRTAPQSRDQGEEGTGASGAGNAPADVGATVPSQAGERDTEEETEEENETEDGAGVDGAPADAGPPADAGSQGGVQ
ncbi:MAG: DUF5667 domain-containing protein [Candidatus Paceibacterota bacterium]